MAEHDAAREFDALQEQLERPPEAAVRNINYDVHIGHAAQRPYARVEDALARVTSGYMSFDQLQSVLPKGEKIEQRDDGTWVRYVWEHVGPDAVRVNAKGVLEHQRRRVTRGVALTQDQARAASTQAGVPGSNALEFDFWNGFTWMRRGVKPEKDLAVLQRVPLEEELAWEEAPPADQALAEAARVRRAVAGEAIPVARKGDK